MLKKWTFDDLSDGNNFFEVNTKTNIIKFWGIDFKKPFSIKITKRIKDFLIKYDMYNNELCEFNQDEDIELLNLCFKTYNNQS